MKKQFFNVLFLPLDASDHDMHLGKRLPFRHGGKFLWGQMLSLAMFGEIPLKADLPIR